MIIGIDEAGRGALAGPVVVAAVAILNKEAISSILLNDSKVLTPRARHKIYSALIKAHKDGHIKLSVKLINNDHIDAHNILDATKEGAEFVMWGILYKKTPDYLGPGHMAFFGPTFDDRFCNATILIDGNVNLVEKDMPPYTNKVECVIKGDSKVPEIMAASIIAKVTRDMFMQEADKFFPGYDFAKSKGYASPKHMQAIINKGPCVIHRKTFKRVKEYVNT